MVFHKLIIGYYESPSDRGLRNPFSGAESISRALKEIWGECVPRGQLLDRVMQEAYLYRMPLMISFVQKLKRLTEMNCGLIFPISLCRKVELCMERNRCVWETIE